MADFSQRHQAELGNVQISCYSTLKQTRDIIKTVVTTEEKVTEANVSIALTKFSLCEYFTACSLTYVYLCCIFM